MTNDQIIGIETMKKFLEAFNSHDMGFSEWTLTGTTPTGERVEVRGTDHLEFRNGKVIRKDSYWKIFEDKN